MTESFRTEYQASDSVIHPISGEDCHFIATWWRRGGILEYSATVDRPEPSLPPIWYGALVIHGNEELPEDELATGFAESLVLAALSSEEPQGKRRSRLSHTSFSPTPPSFARIVRDATTLEHAIQLASISFPILSYPSSGIPGWRSLTRSEFDRLGSCADVRGTLRIAANRFIKVIGLCASQPYSGKAKCRTVLDDKAAVASFRVIYALSWFGLSEEARHVLQQMSLIAKITGRWSTDDVKCWARALFYLDHEKARRFNGDNGAAHII